MNALAERVVALETLVGSEGNRVSLSHSKHIPIQPTSGTPQAGGDTKDSKEELAKTPSIVAELSELTAKFRKFEDKTFSAFFKKYGESSGVLESNAELRSLLLSLEMKEAVVLSCSKDLNQTQKLLEHIQSLTHLLDKVPIQNLDQYLIRLAQLQLNLDSAATVTATLHHQVQAFVDSYFQYISLTSNKFVLWDATITRFEQMVDQALATVTVAQNTAKTISKK